MIRRLAVVFWWVGAIALVLAVSIAAHHQIKVSECKPLLANATELEKQEQHAATEKAIAEAVAQGYDKDMITAFEKGAKPIPWEQAPMTPVEVCKRISENAGANVEIALTVFSLLALIVAYILGGSFFTLPKAR